MSSFEYFADLDEVAAFGDYLVKVEAIPEGGLLHLRTKPVKLRTNSSWVYVTKPKQPAPGWADTLQRCFSHAAMLADRFPDQYRSFKTLRRLTQ
jgi:hypothetical protein